MNSRTFRSIALAFTLALTISPLALAQNDNNSTRARSVANGEKMKIKGVVVRRDADTFTVRDLTGNDTVVRMDDRTSVKSKDGVFSGGSSYQDTNIISGL